MKRNDHKDDSKHYMNNKWLNVCFSHVLLQHVESILFNLFLFELKLS